MFANLKRRKCIWCSYCLSEVQGLIASGWSTILKVCGIGESVAQSSTVAVLLGYFSLFLDGKYFKLMSCYWIIHICIDFLFSHSYLFSVSFFFWLNKTKCRFMFHWQTLVFSLWTDRSVLVKVFISSISIMNFPAAQIPTPRKLVWVWIMISWALRYSMLGTGNKDNCVKIWKLCTYFFNKTSHSVSILQVTWLISSRNNYLSYLRISLPIYHCALHLHTWKLRSVIDDIILDKSELEKSHKWNVL